MLGLFITGITGLFNSWIDTKKAKNQAEANFHMSLAEQEATWDVLALRQSQFSWKDELITLIWFSPLVIAWFDPDRALEWVNFVGELPPFYQIGMFGIMAASFGLRWFFKKQNLKIGDTLNETGR